MIKLEEDYLNQITRLRREIHQNPELSGDEKETPERIIHFINQFKPDEIVKGLGRNGLAAIFNGKNKGKTVMIRAELDALPIYEVNEDIPYHSKDDEVSHKCGHDGHMTMVAALAKLLREHPIENGRVILLFQPAEETGQGAEWIMDDPRFKDIKPDYIFALHNLPFYPLGSIIIKREIFAAWSKGIVIYLKGETSHAAHPEDGNNPAYVMAELILDFKRLSNEEDSFKDFKLITPIFAELGEIAFGTSAGEARLMGTLRAYLADDLKLLTLKLEQKIKQRCEEAGLYFEVTYVEKFPSVLNNDEAVAYIEKAADHCNLKKIKVDVPFKWTEDFGHYSQNIKAGFFGLGAGEHHPQLHNPDYDFPDELLPVGINMFYDIIKQILN